MLKFLIPAALAIGAAGCLAAPPASPPEAPTAASCTATNPSGGDIRLLSCPLSGGRRHVLTVNFQGGHDDTSASLVATLDGLPVPCDADSKPSLFGEDGDVSLHCGVTAPADANANARHTLVVTVLWSHAQYRDFAFAAETSR